MVASQLLEAGSIGTLAKMTASSAFVALALGFGAHRTGYGRLILAGLVLSWLGDLALAGATERQLLERTRSEEAASLLAFWTPVLLILGFVLAYIEMKIPGFGIAGILSIACFALVVFGRFLTGLADVPHIVLLVIGVGFVETRTTWLPLLT